MPSKTKQSTPDKKPDVAKSTPAKAASSTAAKSTSAKKAGPPEGTPPGLPFAIHHHNLVEAGVHNIQNANLAAIAKDKVWLSCTIILPLRASGGSGSPVRPVAIGAPAQ